MGYLGLSSSHCLTGIWLLETGWWGKMFFEFLPSFLYTVFSGRSYGDNLFDFYILFFVLLSSSKFGSQFLLGYAFVRNHTGQSRLLKIWYWIGIITDLILITSIMMIRLTEPRHDAFLDTLILLVQFPMVRGVVWFFVTKLIAQVSAEDKPLVGLTFDRSRIGLTVSTILAWEVVWYTLITLSMLGAMFYGPQIALVTIPSGFPEIVLVLNGMNVLGAVFLWVAIHRNRRFFLIFWLPVYLLLNVIGYSVASYWEATQDESGYWYYSTAPAFYTFKAAKYGLWLCALIFKIGVAIGSILFLCKSETTQGGSDYKEIQPLITSEK